VRYTGRYLSGLPGYIFPGCKPHVVTREEMETTKTQLSDDHRICNQELIIELFGRGEEASKICKICLPFPQLTRGMKEQE